MANEKVYAKGLWAETKTTTFGDITKLSFKVDEFVQFLQEHKNDKGYTNVDILSGKEAGKLYGVLNDFKPSGQQPSNQGDTNDLPF